MMLESNEFQVELVENYEHSGNNNLDQVLIENANHVCLLQTQKWMGQIWTRLKRNPCLRVKCKSVSASTKVRRGVPQLQLRHYASSTSWVPCKRVCVASKRTRLEILFLARGRLGNSIDAEPTKLYPGGQASTATQWTLLRNRTQEPEDPTGDSPLLHSKYPRAMNLVTCGTRRIERRF